MAQASRSLFALVLLVAVTSAANATDIIVDLLGDPVPNGCTPGDCSLREAVALANTLAGPDRILLPATPGVPLQLTIPGENENSNLTGDLDVLDDLEIIGAGADATVLVQTIPDRLLHTMMAPGQRLVLRGLTLQGGRAMEGGALSSSSLVTVEDVAFVDNQAIDDGGAINHRGPSAPAIVEPRLVLRDVRFENNRARSGGALSAVTGFPQGAYALIENCEFRDNAASGGLGTDGGGAIVLSGIPNFVGGDIVIRRSSFIDNVGELGGGALLATFIDLHVEDSLFDGNQALPNGNSSTPASGGAMDLTSLRSARLLRNTFVDNSAERGGALYSQTRSEVIDSYFFSNDATKAGGAIFAQSDLLVERSTLASNIVSSMDNADVGGGAIAFQGNLAGIVRSTLSNNSAFRGGAISLVSGLVVQLYGSTVVAPTIGLAGSQASVLRILDSNQAHAVSIANSIIVGTCTFPSAERRLQRAQGNIQASDSSCRFDEALQGSGNQSSVPTSLIGLGPLADNGGPTLTRLPAAGSVAIDMGSETYCTDPDQRHLVRVDALCDVGAVEVGAVELEEQIFTDGFE